MFPARGKHEGFWGGYDQGVKRIYAPETLQAALRKAQLENEYYVSYEESLDLLKTVI